MGEWYVLLFNGIIIKKVRGIFMEQKRKRIKSILLHFVFLVFENCNHADFYYVSFQKLRFSIRRIRKVECICNATELNEKYHSFYMSGIFFIENVL